MSSARYSRVLFLFGVLGMLALSACSSPEQTLEERRLASERRAAAELAGSDLLAEGPEEGGLEELRPAERAAAVREGAAEEESLDDLVRRTRAPVRSAGEEAHAGEDLPDIDSLLEEGAEEEAAPETARPRERPRRRAPAAGEPRSPDEVLEVLRQDREARQAEANYWASKGDEAFRANDFEKAVEFYRKALDLNPSLDRVRRNLNEALMVLGERKGEVPAIARILSEQHEVQREQTVAEFGRNLDLARNAFREGNVDEAERRARLAVEQAERAVEAIGEERLKEARALLEEIRRERNRRMEEERRRRLGIVQKQKIQELTQEQELKRRQVQDLLRKASSAIFREDYQRAMEACKTVLDLEPDNMVAQFWLRLSKDQLLKERRLKALQDRLENEKLLAQNFQEAINPQTEIFVFPDDDYWERVRRRSAREQDLELQDPEPIRRMKARLEATPVPELDFDNTSLRDVIDAFRQLTNLNILIDTEIDAESDEYRVTQRISNLSAMSALKLILESKGLGFTFEENAMVVTTQEKAHTDVIFNSYLVSDLLMRIRDFEAPEMRLRSQDEGSETAPITFTETFEEEEEPLDADRLIELIQEATGGSDVWTDPNTIEYNQGQLFVNAPRELHARIAEVLENLRQDSDLFVVIEARFIDVNDDFLEDIGLDSRALGLVNNLGTPFGSVINDSSTGGNDIGFVEQGSLNDINLVMGVERWAGRVQHIIDGFGGTVRGRRLNAGGGTGGGTFQATWLEPFQINVILRAVQEKSDVRQLTAPMVTAHNNERVYVSVITQRAYIADYELVSGGTGFSIVEVADPVIQTFQEGVILDVDPTISSDKKYITLDVRPTLATLIGGIISTINISLGSFTNVAFQVPIGVPQISLQQSYTSVTVPNGGTVLLGGFKSLDEGKFTSYIPILGHIPIVKNLVRRKATIVEKRSLVILLTARIVDLRGEEKSRFNPD